MQRLVCACSLALFVATVGSVAAAGELTAGLKVGEGSKAFNVKDITGANKGKSLCYR